MKISEELKKKAIDLGLCNEWSTKWELHHTKQSLINKYKTGLQWCMEKKYPSISYITQNFNELCLENDIFVVGNNVCYNPINAVCRGNTETTIICNDYNVSHIWVGDNAKVKIILKDNAICYVHTFDNAEVEYVQESSFKGTFKILKN